MMVTHRRYDKVSFDTIKYQSMGLVAKLYLTAKSPRTACKAVSENVGVWHMQIEEHESQGNE